MQLKNLLLAQAIAFSSVDAFGLIKSRTMSPTIRTNAQKKAFVYGPLVLKGKDEPKPGGGFSLDPKGQGGTYSITENPCKTVAGGCTVLSAHWRLEYADSGKQASPADGVYIHHLTATDVSKKGFNPFSGGGMNLGGMGAYFGDRGEDSGETATIFTRANNKTSQSGFHLRPSDNIRVSTDLVNYDSKSKNLNLVLEVEYFPGLVGKDTGATLKSAGMRINVTPKGGSGSAVTDSGLMTATARMNIIWARGHLHAGGEKMVLYVNGKEACVSKPTYDSKNVITNMGLCPEIQLQQGNTIKIESFYNTKAHPLRESTDGSGKGAHTIIGGSDVMGMFAMTYEVQ